MRLTCSWPDSPFAHHDPSAPGSTRPRVHHPSTTRPLRVPRCSSLPRPHGVIGPLASSPAPSRPRLRRLRWSERIGSPPGDCVPAPWPLRSVAMSACWWAWTAALLGLLSAPVGWAVELTFELPDNAKECFYEVIEKGVESTLEFQVVTGGQYDVDVILSDPKKVVLYKQVKKQYDSHTFTAEMTGEYQACFSNEFSTFSHKLVYMDFQVGEEAPLPGLGEHLTAMTQMETSSQEVHENLNAIIDYQTHHRLRETQSRKRGEDLNERVMIWSIFVTCAILMVGLGQVLVLKSFFSEKRPAQLYGYH
eukprot:maker-scaffold1518_size37722-snap-gene-0.15 protein:Tk01680 transcript:maker-scaffold1518_size37722-snap-gene-0.15-mRNA-1 annotation:"transmembrane emp24 domain-containing protein 7 precursor"